MFYDYPSVRHERIHEPGGYTDYSNFKHWLRDEFEFRCVYCLMRETWSPAGHEVFGIDHILAKSTHKHLECNYTNLLYCCNRCNSMKLTAELLDPCHEAFGSHVRIENDGEAKGLTVDGQKIVRKLRLNDRHSVRFQRSLITLMQSAMQKPDGGTAKVLRDVLGYPHDLPDLSMLRPPHNSKPDGIAKSHFERWRSGDLPETY